jgi:hypothetical protein
MNIAIPIVRDDQLKVAGRWRDAPDEIVTSANRVHHLASVHKAPFNVPHCVEGHQPIANNCGTPVCKYIVHQFVIVGAAGAATSFCDGARVAHTKKVSAAYTIYNDLFSV